MLQQIKFAWLIYKNEVRRWALAIGGLARHPRKSFPE